MKLLKHYLTLVCLVALLLFNSCLIPVSSQGQKAVLQLVVAIEPILDPALAGISIPSTSMKA